MKVDPSKSFRQLGEPFLKELEKGKLKCILDYWHKHRKTFLVEIRDNFLDLYFLGHGIEIKHSSTGYYMSASKAFNPKEYLRDKSIKIRSNHESGKWKILFNEINGRQFHVIMDKVIAKIVMHRLGNISEGVSELNHFIDNRDIDKNDIFIVDRQVVYPTRNDCKIDLLGLKRLGKGKFTFAVIELKNRNNNKIGEVFSQTKDYVDLVWDNYEHFKVTYEAVLCQKKRLRLLKKKKCYIAEKKEIAKSDIEGIVILDNYNIKSNLIPDRLLDRALTDWSGIGGEYAMKLFLKTNILDSTFFLSYTKAKELLGEYRRCNLRSAAG